MANDELDLSFLNTDDLDGLLGGEAPPRPVVVVTPVEQVDDLADLDPRLKDDLNVSRETLRTQQEIMMQIAKSMAPEVIMAENPKVLEAFTKLMAQMTAAAKANIEVHRSTKDARAVPGVIKQTNQQINAEKVFIGTPSELMDKIGTRQDAQEKEIEGQVVDYDPDKDRATE